MSLPEPELLELHRALVSIPSVSHQEGAIAEFVCRWLEARGASPRRLGDNVVARAGSGPGLLLCSHLDTVPAAGAWTRPPHPASLEGGRVYGLGSNDAKASVAAMLAAFEAVRCRGGPCEVTLLLVPEEETGGKGAEYAWPVLRAEGLRPGAVVVGEPTGLAIARAQKGMLVLELEAAGHVCHSAHARALGATNAIRVLARDLVALEAADLGPEHPLLGRASLEPTILEGGERSNVLPARARAVLDLRSVPGRTHGEWVARLAEGLEGSLRVLSDRLVPRDCPEGAAIVRAARRARPASPLVGSPTMSDLAHFADLEGIKVGPGETERSHRPDEYVTGSELVEGAAFYVRLVECFAEEGAP